MIGAELLMETAAERGVEVCFANPGTTEMPMVEALDGVSKIRPILGLFEGVCTGAADGYGRMAEKPAMALLHLGPGLANGLCNLHNAHRAGTPMLVVVGEHATWHRPYDPPLAMDIEAIAGTVSGWRRTTSRAQNLGFDVAEALAAARCGRLATLIVPFDLQTKPVVAKPAPEVPSVFDAVGDNLIANAAALLRKRGKKALIILGGKSLSRQGQAQAARIKAVSGCDLIAETFPARMERGVGLPRIDRIPYVPDVALNQLAPYEAVVLAGAAKPVAFFGYKDTPASLLGADQEVIALAEGHDATAALARLAEALEAPASPPEELSIRAGEKIPLPSGPLVRDKICAVLAALQPEDAVVVDEGITTSQSYHYFATLAKPFTLLTLTGGAIGQGGPCATGAAIACPERKVINFQADGSALYTLQALWTQAKEKLDVVTLICSNQSYDVLKFEASRLGTHPLGPTVKKLTDLTGLDWVKLGEGFGVPAVAVATAEELSSELSKAFVEKGPKLIEMKLASPM
jgi:acetolactate synthase-1/2/3 large subunit